MAVTYSAVEPHRLEAALIAQIRHVHAVAFAASIVGREYPAEEVAAGLPAEGREPGFRLHVARDHGGRLLGFAYGYEDFLERPTCGWPKRLADAVGDDRYERLDHRFGFAWFGVLPSYQGRGIGSALHDRLFAEVVCDHAWLVCPAHEARLRAFYARRGWELLALDELGTVVERAIMGLDLAKRGKASHRGAVDDEVVRGARRSVRPGVRLGRD